MLTCKEITELVTDYLEGGMSFWQRVRFQVHLGTCRNCRAYLRQMKLTVKTLGNVPREPIPADVRDELLARFRNTYPRARNTPAVPSSIQFLAAVERAIGGRRGWVVSALIFLGALVALILSGLREGPLADGAHCLAVELVTGSIPVVTVGVLSSMNRVRLSVPAFAAIALSGSLVGFAILEFTCPISHVGQHVLPFHLGGMVLAAFVVVGGARLPAFR
jgi:anti-sigma factor RsiW